MQIESQADDRQVVRRGLPITVDSEAGNQHLQSVFGERFRAASIGGKQGGLRPAAKSARDCETTPDHRACVQQSILRSAQIQLLSKMVKRDFANSSILQKQHFDEGSV